MKIKPGQILPLVLIVIDVLAAIVCFAEKDARRGVYWICGGGAQCNGYILGGLV